MTSTDSCPSCGQPRTTRYCGTCGERHLAPDELGFRRFLRSLGEELLPGFEPDEPGAVRRMGGRVYRTVYTLFRYHADRVDGTYSAVDRTHDRIISLDGRQ